MGHPMPTAFTPCASDIERAYGLTHTRAVEMPRTVQSMENVVAARGFVNFRGISAASLVFAASGACETAVSNVLETPGPDPTDRLNLFCEDGMSLIILLFSLAALFRQVACNPT